MSRLCGEFSRSIIFARFVNIHIFNIPNASCSRQLYRSLSECISGSQSVQLIIFMNVKIDSSEIAGLLRKDDIIFQQENDKYRICNITESYVVAIYTGAFARMKSMLLSDLIKECWYVEGSRFAPYSLPH